MGTSNMAASRAVSFCQVLGRNGTTKRLLPTIHTCLVRQIHQTPTLQGKEHFKNIKKGPVAAKGKQKYVSRRTIAKLQEQQELRKTRENRVYIAEHPVDDVWLHNDYPPRRFDVKTAIEMHRELAMPEMFDNMDGLVYFTALLNMKTKKKTKFLGAFGKTIPIPLPFEDGSWNRVVAFALTEEEKEKALEAGASFAGGLDLIKSFEQGELKYEDDYDHVVTTHDILGQLKPIRKIIKDCLPSQSGGSVGEDIEKLVHTFKYGKKYEAIKLEQDIGQITIAIGKLSMPIDQLEDNFHTFVQA